MRRKHSAMTKTLSGILSVAMICSLSAVPALADVVDVEEDVIAVDAEGDSAADESAAPAENVPDETVVLAEATENEPEDPVYEEMVSASIGGVTYYYADTEGDAENTVYQASVTTGRGSSAVTTKYDYTKDQMTEAADSAVYYVVSPTGTALTGTLYGYGDGTSTTYKEVYNGLGVSADDSYDAISSATNFTSFHAKDISSVVTYGTDAEGNKAITGLQLERSPKTVEADAYVAASVLKAAEKELTEEQSAALDITLKKNPTVVPAGTVTPALTSASYTSSRYGTGEFAIVPDDAVEGYVWSEYWDNLYAATVSDGETTVGAVHWIDLYGEDAGTYYVKAYAAADDNNVALESDAAVLKITQAAATVSVKTTAKTLKAATVKKKAQSFSIGASVTSKGKLTYKISKYGNKAAKKYLSISKAGKVVVKKGTPKGTYKITVKVSAAKTTNYKAASKTVTIKVVVK